MSQAAEGCEGYHPGFEEVLPPQSEDVRVVKELALRSNEEIRVGSNPTPRIFYRFLETL